MKNTIILSNISKGNHPMNTLHVLPNTSLASLLEDKGDKSIFCAKVDGKIRDLDYRFDKEENHDIEFLTLANEDASKIYSASIRYLLMMACKEIAPNVQFKMFYNISRTMFAKPVGTTNFSVTPSFVKKLIAKVEELVSKDIPLLKKKVSMEEAVDEYKRLNMKDKLQVLKYRSDAKVHYYEAKDGDFTYCDYLYSYLVPSTGYLRKFTITYYEPGFIVQVPRSECEGEIPPFVDEKKFSLSLSRNYLWEERNHLDTVYSINRFLKNYSSMELINLCETRMNDMLANLGNEIVSSETPIRLICIAGPSSSGKTSFSNRLVFELMNRFLRPVRISMDDYFFPRDQLKPGTSLESIDALDIELFNKQMDELIRGEKVTLPTYDFQTRSRKKGKTLTLMEDQPLIIEGIHALNSLTCANIPSSRKYKIYIAPQPQINLDNHTPISMTDIRLLRRIARDARTRATDARKTIQMWPDVRYGEFNYIYPTQENADFVFDTFMPYELCAIRDIVMPLLDNITSDQEEYLVASRLKSMIKYFTPIGIEDIPCNSLIREFVGGTSFKDAR